MATTRIIRPSLVAGHVAVAMLALAAIIKFALPAAPLPQWHVAGPPGHSIALTPRRLPASRRAERALTD